MKSKNKVAAGVLAICLGAYSAHYFYLSRKEATKRLLLAIFTFGVMATVYEIMGIIDGVKLLKMTDEEFAAYCSENGCTAVPANAPMARAERNKALLEFKGLLDSGAITAAEFERIKSKLLEG